MAGATDRRSRTARPGPSRRRPRTHAPRTMSGCARKIEREARSVGIVVRSCPASGADVRRVDRDQVGLLAGLERADRVVEPERPRAAQRAEPEPVERAEDRATLDAGDARARSGRRTRRA